MAKQEWGEIHRNAVLCVDSYENGILEGRFYHPCHPEGCAFSSLSQFLLKMEQTLDSISFPQSFNMVRTFGETEPLPPLSPTSVQSMKGKAATFSVRILFRQNASWQGSVRWLEGGREQSFRSALELIFLMDSVLGQDAG